MGESEGRFNPLAWDREDGDGLLSRATNQHDAARRNVKMGLLLVSLAGPCLILALQVWWFIPPAICLVAIGAPLLGLTPAIPAGALYPTFYFFPLPICCGAWLADWAAEAHAAGAVTAVLAVATLCASLLTGVWILRRVDRARQQSLPLMTAELADARSQVIAGLILFDAVAPSVLAGIAGLSFEQVTRILDALELRGYVRRQGRLAFRHSSRMVGLTRAGRDALEVR